MKARQLLAVVVVALLAPLTIAAAPTASAAGASRTYTDDADFAEGTSNNVVNSVPGQLQLDDTTEAFPFIWIALSARGTVAKIDTTTGQILGEYSSTSDGDQAHNTSRTTVGLDGSVWAGNRNQSSVIHVGLEEAGQCVDRNGNGTIQTSTGYGNVLPWPGGFNGASSPVSNALDECILHYVDTPGGDARHMSVDGNGDIWAGNWTSGPGAFNTHVFQQIDPATGTIIPGSAFSSPCGGYGGLVDGNGVIWSAHGGGGLMRFDPALPLATPGSSLPTANPRCIGLPIYGLAFDSQNNIWGTQLSGQRIWKVAPSGLTWQSFNQGNPNAQGVAVDANDDVWVSRSLFSSDNRIAHLRNDGTLVGFVQTADPGVSMGAGSTGVSVDAAGKIWTANINSSTATRIDPTRGPVGAGGQPIGIFDLHVNLPGSAPYNYSDMTGATLTGKPGSGTWTVVHDSGEAGTEWGDIDWTADVPAGGALSVTAATSENGTTFGPAQSASDGVDLTGATGRYIRVTVTFTRAGANGDSPILYDISISGANEAPVADAGGAYDVNEGDSVTLDGTGSTDADGDTLTYDWDLDGDSTYETSGATVSYAADDGPDTRTADLRVCDPSGECDTDTATITIHNVGPTADAGDDQTVYRNDNVDLSGTWTDPAGSLDDPYPWTWDDGNGSTAAGSGSYGSSGDMSTAYATEGTYTATFGVTDDDGASDGDTATITVLNRAPECGAASPSQASIWPPNHQMVPVTVNGVTDGEGDTTTITVTSIRQDEPTNTIGDGNFSPDGTGVGTSTAEVRAERSGSKKVPGDGRVYHIGFTADDGHGGTCSGTVTVSVPHSNNGTPAVDGGPLYDSTV